MAVKIRLKVTGKRNARTFRIVAVDESKKREGKVIEELGWINPNATPPSHVNSERLVYWQKVGAQVTEAVKKLSLRAK